MDSRRENLYAGLKRVFHEPSRLAILSSLCRAADGMTFNELKADCGLTFGNLSSHLKTLHEAGIVDIHKAFVANKPCTTVVLTDGGREQFVAYLEALEEVLRLTAEAVSQEQKHPVSGLTPGAAQA